MSQDDLLHEDLRPEELADRLRELPGEAVPTSRSPLSRRSRVLLRMAAALAIFAGGVWVGRGTVERPRSVTH